MLKKIRVAVSVFLFVLITLYLLDFAEIFPAQFVFLAKIQLIPALLALNVVILISIFLLTFIFGRIYCSSVCPMGIYQDITARISKYFRKKKRYRYFYSPAKKILRYGTLAAVTVSFLFGFTFLLGLLDPYGAYGRITVHFFRPAYLAGNNLLEIIFTKFDNYRFYKVGIYGLGVFSTVTALITMFGVGFLAWRNGRTFCNTLCPAGTLLGFVSKYSLFKIRFIDSKCNSCGLCSMSCKASCIDSKNLVIDYSRCVACFNCLESCNRDAMKYSLSDYFVPKKEVSASEVNGSEKRRREESRRRFLVSVMVTVAAAGKLLAQEAVGAILPKRELKRVIPVAPPGVPDFEHLRKKCISCHLCVSKCPADIIKPSFLEYGIGGMMQPLLNFDHGFCNYNCTICGDVCPTGAILPLTVEEKNHNQTGRVNFILENCIVYYDETNCGACSEHCPTQAVHMVPYKGALTIPEIDPDICVGCGACEYACPAIPYKSIYVEGVTVQKTITIEHEEHQEFDIDDFGF